MLTHVLYVVRVVDTETGIIDQDVQGRECLDDALGARFLRVCHYGSLPLPRLPGATSV